MFRAAGHKGVTAPKIVCADRVSLISTVFALFNLVNYFAHSFLFSVSSDSALAIGAVSSLLAFASALSILCL